jgi:4-hydroxy-3-polyprenylbenzoate decarboxylase
MQSGKHAVVCAVSGASCGPLALRLLHRLFTCDLTLHLVFSPTGSRIFRQETGVEPRLEAVIADMQSAGTALAAEVHQYEPGDLFGLIASGSCSWDAMVVCPCSMGMLARIAAGYSNCLITRCADVALKERRKLVLAARETPLSTIHLENMLRVTHAGAVVLPPVIGYYYKPRTLEDVNDALVERIMQHCGLETTERWKWNPEEAG